MPLRLRAKFGGRMPPLHDTHAGYKKIEGHRNSATLVCVRDEDTILELIFLSLNNPTKLNLA